MDKEQHIKHAQLFHDLHYSGEMLLLPNTWDILGALVVEHLGFKAIATASAAMSYINGFFDGEKLPFEKLIKVLKNTTNVVTIPVTADIESGYARTNEELKNNIIQLLECGISGLNIEDTNIKTKNLYSIEEQCARIRTIRSIADDFGVPLFINARTDIYLDGNLFTTEEIRLEETLKRIIAYKNAGANGIYPIAITHVNSIKEIVAHSNIPVNVLAFHDAPPLKKLQEIGVSRVSLASGLLKSGIDAMMQSANKFKKMEEYSAFLSRDVTSDFIKSLLKQNPRET